MRRGPRRLRNGESGYILLVLLLAFAVLSIGFTVAIQGLEFQIRRDREEELIHRGVQYSRAVRKFIKAFGRYPNSIEELENTNNKRFLRKRYKDPISGKDFKVLRLMDLPSSQALAGAITAPTMVRRQGSSSKAPDASGEAAGTSVGSEGSEPQPSSSDGESSEAAPPNQNQSSVSGTSSAPPAPPTQKFSGGPIVGVASLSKRTTIREFDGKNHYNEWQFVYDPSTDRGVLLTTPNQPAFRAGQIPNGQAEQGSLSAVEANSGQRHPTDGVQ